MAASFICKTLQPMSYLMDNSYKIVKNKAFYCQLWRQLILTQKRSTSGSAPVTGSEGDTTRDPFPTFSNPQVRMLLESITGFDALKLAGSSKKPLNTPTYKLLTDEELKKETEAAQKQLRRRLDMPPVLKARTDPQTILAKDPELVGLDTSSFVFVDTSLGVTDRKRNVVIREPDGTLKVAPCEIKDRMNQIYNPRGGREFFVPKMFNQEHLQRMISEKRYVYILDRACCQFEPDDPKYFEVTRAVYDAVDACKEFQTLRSTRHFGPFAFYLLWNQRIDYLLLDMINRDLSSDALSLIRLYSIIHPHSEVAAAVSTLPDPNPSALIKAYIEKGARLKGQLELALQAMEDALRARKNTGKRATA